VAELSRAERDLLRRLADVGGKYTFRPDGETATARRAFEQGIITTLLSLHEKQLIRINTQESIRVTLPGQPEHFTSISVELTEEGQKVAGFRK
jgi:hypothetical protein